MKLHAFCDRLDDLLDTDAYADVDGSPNGLQVGDDGADIAHAAFAVDAAQATIDEAASAGADVLVTHHGLWWEGIERLTGRTYDRVARLIEADMALYVSHLPLDGHAELGNAAGLARLLELEEVAPFAHAGDVTLGRRGRLSGPPTVAELADELAERLPGNVGGVDTLEFGPSEVEDVAILTGSGVDWLDEAIEREVDLLLTGEGKQSVYHEAREAEINVMLAGHYATETFGVRSLAELAQEWGLQTTFIEHPTGL